MYRERERERERDCLAAKVESKSLGRAGHDDPDGGSE